MVDTTLLIKNADLLCTMEPSESAPFGAEISDSGLFARNGVIEQVGKTINLPDTVGYTLPQEYASLFAYLIEKTPTGGKDIVWSTHCHNDLGLATANTLAGIHGGARQAEVKGQTEAQARQKAVKRAAQRAVGLRVDSDTNRPRTRFRQRDGARSPAIEVPLAGDLLQPCPPASRRLQPHGRGHQSLIPSEARNRALEPFNLALAPQRSPPGRRLQL